jgi:Arc/MetJ-type ribon-helix-helix transcriptional regulator
MNTINISLPVKLKSRAETLVKAGYYASFSDMVRDSLRCLIEKNRYDYWIEEAKNDLKKGKATALKSSKAVDAYLKRI